jgi:choline kinase
MKAVILAAGRGTRIRTATLGRPKCLLEVGGRTILDWQIDALWSAGVTEIGMVLGYEGHEIIDHIDRNYGREMDAFHFMWNPVYAATNNIYSLWMAREWLDSEDFVCLNADVLFHPAILPPALRVPRSATMIVDPEWRDETMKVIIEDGSVVWMRKGIPREEFSGTYIGVTVFSRHIGRLLFRRIGGLVHDGFVNDFFNRAVQNMVDDGLRVGVSSTAGLPWAEVDDPADLTYARVVVAPRLPGAALVLEPYPAVA